MDEAAEARAEQLLGAHLDPAQRAEWEAFGRVTVVKRGFVWSVLILELVKALPLVALVALPEWRVAAFVVFLAVVICSKPFWVPRFTVASARRREWSVSPHRSPVVLAHGREVRFCAMFREPLPPADRVLAWKQLLELSEGHFLRKANVRE